VNHTAPWYCHVEWCVGLVAGVDGVFRVPVGRLAVALTGLRLVCVVRLFVVMVVVVVCDGGGGDGGFGVDGRVFRIVVPSVVVFVFLAATKSGSYTKRMVGLSWKVSNFHAAVDLVRPSASCRSLLTQRILRSSVRILSLHASTSIDVRFSERFSPVDKDRSTAS